VDAQGALALLMGIGLGWLFLRRQRQLTDPFLDLDLFKSKAFSLAVGINALTLFFMFGVWILMAQSFQLVHGLSPLQAGLWSLPSAIAFAVASPFNAMLIARFGQVNVLFYSLLVSAAGLAGMAAAPSLIPFVAGGVVMALGMTPVFGITVGIVVGTAPVEKSGVASALSETGAELGGASGIAILGSLLTVIYRLRMAEADLSQLPAADAAAMRLSLASATDIAARLPEAGRALDAARNAFMGGFALAAGLAALAILALAFAARRVFSGIKISEAGGH
nr:MFS transporter [Rhizobiaceae bacterium]